MSERKVAPLRKPVACPNCSAVSDRAHYPFCSQRCRETDLHRWFAGSYAIAGRESEEDPYEV